MNTKLQLISVLAAGLALQGAAMPTEAEVEKAVPKVERMLASEKVALVSGKMTRAEVAAAAMKLAADADDEAAKLLLMKGAFILHVKDGNLEKAVKTMNALETAIADISPQIVTNIIEMAFADVHKNESARLYQLLDGRRKNDTSKDRQYVRPKLAQLLGRERQITKQRSVQQSVRSTIKKASENTEEIGGYTWSYKIEHGTALIEAGDMFSCPVSPKPTGHLTIPQTLGGAKVGGIGFNASFRDCDELTSVTIPSSIEHVGFAFNACSGLMAFSVDSGNRSYSAKNGMLCSKDGTTLVRGVNGNVTIPSGITSIGGSAFSGLRGLKSVIIPSSVIEIRYGAFDGCSGLTSIEVEEANPAYRSIDGMLFSKDGQTLIRGVNGNVTIPSGVTAIGGCAFSRCRGLKSVMIPVGVTNIGCCAFEDCRDLKSVTIPSSVRGIEKGAFCDCGQLRTIEVDDANPTYRSIEGSLYTKDGRTLIRGVNGNVTIQLGVTSIGDSAFSGCRGLKSIVIPSGVTNIGSSAFMHCDELLSVTIPSSVANIGGHAFLWCSGLKSVTIPQGVTHIGDAAFLGCSRLVSVSLPDSLTSIEGDSLFNKTPFYENMPDGLVIVGGGVLCGYKGQCSSSVTIPSSVKVIGDHAFSKKDGLSAVTIQEGVKRISRCAFSECKGLSSITIPSTVTNIGDFAFFNCTGLRSVNILSEVTRIGGDSFAGCKSLTSLTIPSSVTNIHESAFGNRLLRYCPNLKSVDVVRNGIVKSMSFDDFVKTFKRGKNQTYEDGATVGGYTWSYRTQNDKATIMPSLGLRRGTGTCCAVSPNPTGGIEIPASLGGVRVTGVQRNAFCGCTNLTSVSIPSSVTRIEPGAFSRCSSLMRFSVDPANPSYSARNGLLCSKDGTKLVAGVNGEVEIPLGVKSIGRSAFYDSAGLKSVVIPASVTNVDISAFVGCGGLMSIEVDETNAVYCSRNGMLLSKDGATLVVGVNGEVMIPPGVTIIRESAFMGRSRLTAITIPKGVVSIGGSAFSFCRKLGSVTIPSSVTNLVANYIGSPFSYGGEHMSFLVDPSNPVYSSRNGLLCSKDGTTLLVGTNGDVVIPMGVTKIECGAFSGCGRLTSVKIPSSVTSIGDRAFINCRRLTSVQIPSSVSSIGSDAFSNTSFYECLPDGMVILGGGVLYEYKGQCPPYVSIPEGVMSIGNHAFYGERLKYLTIPTSVTNIGDHAFGFCHALAHLTIPSTVTNIEWNAFCGGRGYDLKTVDVVKDGNVETVTFEEFSKLWESKRPSGKHSIRWGLLRD